jgi:flavorubredoxin
MAVTNRQSGTNVHEVSDGIYRINTPVVFEGGGEFSFNQYLIADDEPLLFHTGPRKMFSLVREAVASVLPVEQLSYIAFSHVEADECGSLNEWLAVAPTPRALVRCPASTARMGLWFSDRGTNPDFSVRRSVHTGRH